MVVISTLIFTTLGAYSADDKLKVFFPENRHEHFIQIGGNLHESSKPVFWKK